MDSIVALRAIDHASRDQHLSFFPSGHLSQESVERLNTLVAPKEGKRTMMTFKEFYLHSSKGNKAPPRAWRRVKTYAMPNKILDRIKKLKAVKRRLGVGS
jgi:hypothetical protein